MTTIVHPLTVGTIVKANKPGCPCRAARWTIVQGKIQKVINNNSGVWYYLSNNTTVKSDWVEQIVI